ncbi:MAG TPA: type II secretion system F family protein [Candidatus Bathyarchaeia archaeon]|nr:type II secretion system F family protein [Candidatus Bathyarchaeia archaeon]
MQLFEYRAVDTEGNSIRGAMEGAFAHEVVVALQEKGWMVNSVRPERRVTAGRGERRLTWDDLAQLNAQLAMITRSSLPLVPSLRALADDTVNPRIKSVLDDVKRYVEAGNSLEAAVHRHAGAFNPVYRALITAGERAGNLPRVFETLTAYSTSMANMKKNLQLAMAYPLVVMVSAFLLLVVFMLKVIPVFANVYRDFDQPLPAPTQFLFHISAFFQAHGIETVAAFAALLVAGIAAVRYTSRDRRYYWADWIRMRIPLYKAASLARFCRAFSLLVESRVPVLESLEIAGAAAGNAVLHRKVRKAAAAVNAGLPLAEAFQKTKFFDGPFCWLVSNAERTGAMEETFRVMADEYDRSLENLFLLAVTFIGPMVIVLGGILTGFLVIALYLPIYGISDTMH